MRVIGKAMAIGALTVAALLAATSGPAQAASTFTIRVVPLSNPFLYLDVDHAQTGDGAGVIVWSRSGNNQVWTFQPVGAAYQIVNQRSGKCLQTNGPGTQLVQWRCKGTGNQLWNTDLTPNSITAHAIWNADSAVYMDVSGNGGAGSPVIGWYPNGGTNQSWLVGFGS
ncbi:RICIN domain-containing protein [Sphaerisporangium aureirubrum]|uniref:RICIN domain-containing protein n=1 Tax=Sphaerisporangium aureirubrum TaxID=1544736 RepID=A0ABW1NIQ6_9ACTN